MAEFDVVVIGFGTAGASAAIAAHDAGRNVLVLEAGPHGGGNALYSGGFLFDIPEPYTVEHLDSLSFGRTDRAVLETYARGLHDLDAWFESLGGRTVAFDPPPIRLPSSWPAWPHWPAADRVEYRFIDGGDGRRGEALWDLLDGAVRERGIEVRYGTRVGELLIGDDGAVEGVVLDGGDEVRARGGVVLACGGFEADAALSDSYLPLGPVREVGHPYADGAGLLMGQQAGADLWHMYGFFGWFAFSAPEFPTPFTLDFYAPGFVLVDADGHRFADETGYEVHDRLRALLNYLPRNHNRPRLPAYAVFDDATRLAGPLNGLLGTPNDYVWSEDNAAEVERGWIAAADSPRALAAAIGVDADALAVTLAEYNADASAGRDERFSRSADTLVPLDGRLYAIETWPGVAGTTGGPRHDAESRVLRRGGEPVPGLYAAGAVSLVFGHLIDYGGGLTDAMVFGRAAGTHAARRAADRASS